MSTYQSSRSSASSTSSSGSSYQLILDHILTYPGSYEIPLRTMYALNCAPQAATATPTSPTVSSPATSHLSQAFFTSDTPSTASLTENLVAQLSQLPTRLQQLHPSFITAFVQRCFPSSLIHVDFPQALTALDYLKDLETRRRREVASAFSRLAIDKESLDQDASALSEKYPGVLQWIQDIEEKERKIDALYTQLYVGLRRWILINELKLQPFHKHNCVAMLNTLYPPAGMTGQPPPTSRLTPAVLKAQRDGFFKYIQAVERSGSRILATLIQQGKAPADENGWAAVVRNLTMYLQVANSIISECAHVATVGDVSPNKSHEPHSSRHTRKADSGISLGGVPSLATSEDRPATRNAEKEPMSPVDMFRPKTPNGGRPGTALEKLARGLKTIGRNRTDVTEMIDYENSPEQASAADKPTILRKMRSLGSLGDRRSGSISRQNSATTPSFDVDAMRRARAEYEARLSQCGVRASNEE